MASASLARGLSSEPRPSVSPGSMSFRRKSRSSVIRKGFEKPRARLMVSFIRMELYSPLRKLCGTHRCGPLGGDYLAGHHIRSYQHGACCYRRMLIAHGKETDHRCRSGPCAKRFTNAKIRRGRSDRGSLPWSTRPQSPSQTSHSSPRKHKLPRARAAASANRRSGRHGLRSI